MQFLKSKKFIIICILLIVVGIIFYLINKMPIFPKWIFEKWQEKYGTEVSIIRTSYLKDNYIIKEKYYQEIIDTISNEINENIRFNETVTYKDISDEDFTSMIGVDIYFKTPNDEHLNSNTQVLIYTTEKSNYLLYNYDKSLKYVIKKMDKSSFDKIYKYLKNGKYFEN